jgi:lipoprotein-releasing system permease protein
VLLDLELAIRFLRRRAGALLRGTALAALVGVALATAALVVTLALMRGYTESIARALQRGNAHVVGFAPAGMDVDEARATADRLTTVAGVRRASPVTYFTALADDPSSPTTPVPVTVKAVDDPPAYTGLDEWPGSDVPPAVLGARLAGALRIEPDRVVTLRLPPSGSSWVLPTVALRAVGTFRLEFAEFDATWVIAPLDRILAAVPRASVAGIEIELDDPMAVADARERLEKVDRRLLFTDWRDMNRSLFAALRWQTLSLFVVLALVVAVASFQVASAMVVLSIDKRRAAGMLQALGATPGRVRRILLFAGTLLGMAGVGLGVAVGWAASWMLTTLNVIRFPEGLARVYMVDSIPFRVSPEHLGAIVATCGVLVVVASLIPAWRTSRMDPVDALRAV